DYKVTGVQTCALPISLLAARGYCVFALTYGIDPRWRYMGGVIPIERSAPELGAFVRRVLAATHARRVDLVGHSEGTFMPQYWLRSEERRVGKECRARW